MFGVALVLVIVELFCFQNDEPLCSVLLCNCVVSLSAWLFENKQRTDTH